MRIGIIGGGASGMILASKLKNKDVTIIEKNNKLGKKLLLTGNGKCNFTNMDFSCVTEIYNNEFAVNCFKKYDNISFINYFKSLGIVPKIETHKNRDYVYPNTNKSSSVYYCLYDKIISNNTKILYNTCAYDIRIEDNIFLIDIGNDQTLKFDKLVISTGGCSYKNTGSDGSFFSVIKNIGHKVTDLHPGLCPLSYKNKLDFKNSFRVNALLYVLNNEKIIYKEFGEIQFNEKSISGIPILNISNKTHLNKSLSKIYLDFSYNLLSDNDDNINTANRINELINILTLRKKELSYRKTIDFLNGFLPDELNEFIYKKCKIDKNNVFELTDENIKNIAKEIICFEIDLSDDKSFENAQITLGGVDTNYINIDSLESKIIKGLYFTGEVLDIDGICGGYNLQLAYSTASIVADNI